MSERQVVMPSLSVTDDTAEVERGLLLWGMVDHGFPQTLAGLLPAGRLQPWRVTVPGSKALGRLAFLSWVCHEADCTTSLHTPSQGHMFHWFHFETHRYPHILNSPFLLAILFTGWCLFPVVSWSIIHYNVYLNLCGCVPACLCMLTNQIIKPIFSKDIRLFSIN